MRLEQRLKDQVHFCTCAATPQEEVILSIEEVWTKAQRGGEGETKQAGGGSDTGSAGTRVANWVQTGREDHGEVRMAKSVIVSILSLRAGVTLNSKDPERQQSAAGELRFLPFYTIPPYFLHLLGVGGTSQPRFG